jgi:hypothetical protein
MTVLPFEPGDRVRMRPEMRPQFAGPYFGTVLGAGFGRGTVRIRRDGQEATTCWSAAYWERVRRDLMVPCGNCLSLTADAELDTCVGCGDVDFCERCMLRHRCVRGEEAMS